MTAPQDSDVHGISLAYNRIQNEGMMGSPTNPDQRIGKQHVKKKLFRVMCKIQASAGKINTADGQWTARNGIPDTSMRRDFNSGKGA